MMKCFSATYFFVSGFHNRGNEHDHALLWIEGALIYGDDNNSQIEQIVEKYITCNKDHLDPELAKVHRHYHTKSCNKRKKLTLQIQLPRATNENNKNHRAT